MAKRRKRRRKSLLTQGLNALTAFIALSPLISLLMRGGSPTDIVRGYSAGLSEGSFDRDRAIQWYGPLIAAVLFRKAVSMARKAGHF